MPLQRKRGFYRDPKPISPPTLSGCHLNRHPEVDYYPCYPSQAGATTWAGQSRHVATRKIVMVKRFRTRTLSDIHKLTSISHENVARPISLYYSGEEFYVIHEFFYLDIFDLLPLSANEVSCVMKQVSQVHGLGGHILTPDKIRVDINGLVKIVLDWDMESCVESLYVEANEYYLIEYLREILVTLYCGNKQLPADAEDFLNTNALPAITHPYIRQADNPRILRQAVHFAIQKKMLIKNFAWPDHS
ncbi:kinase domain-containing [Fusarium albosuccineum]|uniref:Kinase domain-containing n=1 Tax=Fusarium albosuccineum TaxID=1237068 RepID=A0A8H4L310_9HYPO|nr:kinase domain-containing [Fusarium albosuccineum]